MLFRFCLFLFLATQLHTLAGAPAFVNDSLSQQEEESYLQSKPLEKGYFDNEKWQNAKKGIKYENDKEEEQEEKPSQTKTPFSFQHVKYVIFAVVIIVLVAVIAAFVTHFHPTKSTKTSIEAVSVDTAPQKEEDLLSLGLEPYIAEAIQNKHFSLATRFLYLLALQRLVKARMVHWSKDQTNRHILYQVQNRSFSFVLQRIFSVYESVWFGQKAMDEEGFSSFQNTHTDFLNQLETSKS